MKLIIVIVLLVTAFTGYCSQAQLTSTGPKMYNYIDEVPELLGESESPNSAFANEERDSGSFTEVQQVLKEPDNYSYIDEDQHIMDGNLVIADVPKNPAYTEVDDMSMLLRISYWCRNREGRCRRRHIPCEDREDIETPYGGSFCNRNSRRCCYPSPCRKKWCEKANEECVANNWATEGSCQCKGGYIRDKLNNCVATCSVIWCEAAKEECDDKKGTTAGSCQCADGYVRDKRNNCVGTCAVIWCDKDKEECEDKKGTTAGSCQCADGYVRDKQNNCIGTCAVIWCDKANEECHDNNGRTAGCCQCADGYVRDKQNNCIATCAVIWCDKANEECDDTNGTTAASCQCADGYVRDKQNNCIVTTTTSAPTTTVTSTTTPTTTTTVAPTPTTSFFFKLQRRSTTTAPGCGGEYTSSSGTIRHPSSGGNYQDNENCVWIIRATLPLEITFTRFDTESGYDFLYVRNGDSVEGSFTGSSVPSPIVITANTATLLFTSDGSETKTGFEIQWEPLIAA